MHIQFTEPAADFIQARYFRENRTGGLKLIYDTEGCGCAVSGVAGLWVIDEPNTGDEKAASNSFEVCFEPRHEVFFEDKLVIDLSASSRALVLKSANQIYNPSMKITDRRA